MRANPPKDYLRLRNALYDAATQADTGSVMQQSQRTAEESLNSTLVTDRRFRNYNPNRPPRSKHARDRARGKQEKGPRYAGGSKICWTCGQNGCHSSKHTAEERKPARNRMRSFLSEALIKSESDEMPEKNEFEEDSNPSVMFRNQIPDGSFSS